MPKIKLNLKFIVEKERIIYFAKFLNIKIKKNIFREANANLHRIKNNWVANKQLSEKIINDLFKNHSFRGKIKVSIFPLCFYLGAVETKKQLILFGQPLRSKNFALAVILHEITHIFLSRIKIKRKPIIDEIVCFLVEEMVYQGENKHLEEIWTRRELDVFHRKALETAIKYRDKLIFKGNIKKNIKYLFHFFKKELPERITDIICPTGLLKNIKIKNKKMNKKIIIKDKNEEALIEELNKRKDIKAERIKRFLSLPDLTKKENSPVKILFDQIINLPRFKDFDLVDFPRIVTVEQCFDLLNMPKTHPSRRETDTYYLDDTHVLRTHTTVFWSFYLKDPEVLERLEKDNCVQALSAGIVFRKDEIDRNHYPAFHQIDGLCICKKAKKVITQEDLKDVQADLAKGIFGTNLEWKFVADEFPYTVESLEMNIMFNGNWMEVNGAGLVHPQVLKNFGLDPEIYNGWAFGFGDRLAMIKMGIPDIRILWSKDPRITSQFKDINSKYKEVSKYPTTDRDISFVIDKDVSLNNYYEIVRDCSSDVVEEVELLDKYENPEKFGKDKISYTFRIVYRSPERTLESEEINKIQEEIRQKTVRELKAILR